MTLEQHAEAILRALIDDQQLPPMKSHIRSAFLAACAALWNEAHDAGAAAMQEAAGDIAEHRCDDGEDDFCCEDTAFCIHVLIAAIDPASLRKDV